MESITEGFGLEKVETMSEVEAEAAIPITAKTTPEEIRIDLKSLETVYMTNGTVFNGVNKIVQTIMAAGYSLVDSNQRRKQFYERFLDNIGSTGGKLTRDELFTRIFQYQCIYGGAWVENIYNKKGNRILDLDTINSTQMDYAKNSMNKIVLDPVGNPVGFTQTIPLSAGISISELRKFPAPPKVSLKHNQIFLPPERVVQFKLYTVGDGFYPIGLIEPIYNQSLWKGNVEKGLANFIYRLGFAPLTITVGDLNHEPTPAQIERALEKGKDLSNKQVIAVPYWYKLQTIEVRKLEKMKDNLEYFKEQEIAGMGIPKPFVTGGGEDTNRATLVNQSKIFRLTLKDIISRTIATIHRDIFQKIAELEGFNGYPKIKWGEVQEEEMADKADRMAKYANAKLLTPTPEIEKYIKKIENLEIEETER